jgi:hypothetical protein
MSSRNQRNNNAGPRFRKKQGNVTLANSNRRRNRNRQLANRQRQVRQPRRNLGLRKDDANYTNLATQKTPEEAFLEHFDGTTRQLAEAITNPFSDQAIGAVIPDQWAPPSIPAMDILSFDIDPQALVTTYVAEELAIRAVITAFVPRSLAAGWIATDGGDPVVNIISTDTTFGRQEIKPLADLYCLFIGFIGTTKYFTDPVILCIDTLGAGTNADPKVKLGYNAVQFSRIQALKANVTGARICGAGLKLFTDEAPIETGGTVYGGWMPIHDLHKAVTFSESLSVKRGAFSLQREPRDSDGWHVPSKAPKVGATILPGLPSLTIQDRLRYRGVYKGLDGVTVRYSPLQSSNQEDFEPIFEDALFDNAESIYQPIANLGVGVHDAIGTSDYVPASVWWFNSVTSLYSVRLLARVHIQCEPDGGCPFMTGTVKPDLRYQHLQVILENKAAFPVTSKANSFKAFNEGLREVFTTIGHGAKVLSNIFKLF